MGSKLKNLLERTIASVEYIYIIYIYYVCYIVLYAQFLLLLKVTFVISLHILTSAIPETVCHYLRIMFPNELKDRSFKHYPP